MVDERTVTSPKRIFSANEVAAFDRVKSRDLHQVKWETLKVDGKRSNRTTAFLAAQCRASGTIYALPFFSSTHLPPCYVPTG